MKKPCRVDDYAKMAPKGVFMGHLFAGPGVANGKPVDGADLASEQIL